MRKQSFHHRSPDTLGGVNKFFYAVSFAVSFTELAIIAYRTYQVKINTPGNPPLAGVLIITGICLLSFVCSLLSRKRT